jgi:hypothetical protein
LGNSDEVGGISQDHDFLSLELGLSLSSATAPILPVYLVPKTNIKTFFDMKVGVDINLGDSASRWERTSEIASLDQDQKQEESTISLM